MSKASYDDGSSSDSSHDAYLERMKAEGEERDSEDGELTQTDTCSFLKDRRMVDPQVTGPHRQASMVSVLCVQSIPIPTCM